MLGYEAEKANLTIWFCLPHGELRTAGEMEAATVASVLDTDGDIITAETYLKTLRSVTNRNEVGDTSDDAAVIPISDSVTIDQLAENVDI
jgi:hypothetical protein